MTVSMDAPVVAHRQRVSRWLLGVGLVIMLAGLLFGYDQGVIAGALEGIRTDFSVGTTLTEIITSWVTLGALVGALIAGVLADGIGRRRTILAAAALFTVGAAVEAFAPTAAVAGASPSPPPPTGPAHGSSASSS